MNGNEFGVWIDFSKAEFSSESVIKFGSLN